MSATLSQELSLAVQLFNESGPRVVWNTFLALIPCGLSFWLFRHQAPRNWSWWPILVIFILFLPNAPYVLTDSLHIWELSHQDYHLWSVILILLPQYMVFIGVSFQAYAIALAKLETYCQTTKIVNQQQLFMVKGMIHGLCIVGIYLGRFERFNSWDLLHRPVVILKTTLLNLANPAIMSSMGSGLLIIWLLAEYVMMVNRRLLTHPIFSRLTR